MTKELGRDQILLGCQGQTWVLTGQVRGLGLDQIEQLFRRVTGYPDMTACFTFGERQKGVPVGRISFDPLKDPVDFLPIGTEILDIAGIRPPSPTDIYLQTPDGRREKIS